MQAGKVSSQTVFISVLLISVLLLMSLFQQGLQAKTDGAPSGNTGSPGDDQTCAHVKCHTGTAQDRPGIISSNVPETGYRSDAVYTITVFMIDTGIVKFGFQASPQDLAGDKLGTMSIIDADRTKFTGGGKYITHKEAGTAAVDTATWTFNWQSGSSTGDVTFYVAVNATNNEENATGDKIYIDKLVIPEDPNNIPVPINGFELSIQQCWQVADGWYLQTNATGDCTVQIFSLSGQLMYTEQFSQGNEAFFIPNTQLPAGNYVMSVSSKQSFAARKVMVW